MKVITRDSILNGLASDHFHLKDADHMEMQQSLYIERETAQDWLSSIDIGNEAVDIIAASLNHLPPLRRALFNRLLTATLDGTSLNDANRLVEELAALLMEQVRDEILAEMPRKLAQYEMRQKCSSL